MGDGVPLAKGHGISPQDANTYLLYYLIDGLLQKLARRCLCQRRKSQLFLCSHPRVLKLMRRSTVAMAEAKSRSFLWPLLLFFVCPLLCCGILSSNSNIFDAGSTVPGSPIASSSPIASASLTIQTNLPTTEAITATAVPPLPGRFTQVPLLSYLNNKGIGSAPGEANFDGSGFSYPAMQLPPGGPRLLGGVRYLFPKSAPKTNDNIAALGQVIKFSPGKYQRAFMLVSTSWGTSNNPLSVTVHYADGSTSSGSFSSPDWADGPSGVVNISHRYSSTDAQGPAHIYAVQIAMDSTKIASSLTLPTTALPKVGVPCLHVFALTLQ
jgi:hypothetical protein